MAFSRLASSAGAVIPSASLVGPFGGLEKLRALASKLCRVVVLANDLRAALVSKVGIWLLGT